MCTLIKYRTLPHKSVVGFAKSFAVAYRAVTDLKAYLLKIINPYA